MDRRAYFDRFDRFIHPCDAPGCARDGTFGFGVRLRAGRLGRWYCAEHRAMGEGVKVENGGTSLLSRPAPAGPARQERLL